MGYTKDAIKGISWMGLLRFCSRTIAFIKIGILARLLTPFQYGLFGIAGLVLVFLETFTETGINVFLIQEENIENYINTAWVISILRGTLISSILLISAPLISGFFKTYESERLIYLIAVVPFIRGFINPAIVNLRKELKFKKEFLLKISLFLIESSVTVVYVLITKSVLGLIIGLIIGAICEVLISHLLFKPKPKLILKTKLARRIIKRGKWVTSSGIFNFLAHQGDDILVGYLLNPSFLGLYQNAYKISTLPLTEIAQVTTQVTFPIYSKIAKEIRRLKKAYKKVFLTSSVLIVPLGLILFSFPEKVILVILGKNWLEAANVLRILSIYGIGKAFLNITKSVFLSLKKQSIVAKLSFLEFISLFLVAIPLINSYKIVGAGYASVISVVLAFPLALTYLNKTLRDEE